MSMRADLSQEIESTKVEFHQLLNTIPIEAYRLPSDNPAWTVGEVLYHMSIAPRLLGKDVRMIVGHSWIYRAIPIILPGKLFDWLNKELTLYGVRNASREFLAQEYDKAHAAALKALNEVEDADFGKKVSYPDWDPFLSGEVTVEKLFRYVKAHFDSHAEQIRQIAAISFEDSPGMAEVIDTD